MDILRELIITIVSAIVFVAFVEILIPNSSHKRYINVVVGFLLMIVILSPLKKLLIGEVNFEEIIVNTSNDLELKTAKNRIENIQYSNNDTIIKLYKNEISQQIKNHIEENTEYFVKEVAVSVEENHAKPEFGSVKSFDITLIEEKENTRHDRENIRPVKINVSIGGKINNTIEAGSILINNESDLIKEELSSFYNVSSDKINIRILKNK